MFMWLTGNLSREPKISPGQLQVSEQSAAGIKTLLVETTSVLLTVEAVGTVEARTKAEISSRIMAGIIEVAADAGDPVESGQILFLLDARDAKARLEQAREALSSAEAAMERASLDAGRFERLYDKQAATKREYDESRTALKIARATVDSTLAAIRESEAALSHTKIVSPIGGRVIDRLADSGDMAIPGKPLMTIYDLSTLRLEVSVAEHLRPNVSLNESMKVSIDSVALEIEGKVEEIVPASDASSRSFTARVSIPETDGVYPGVYGRIHLNVGSAETILIPSEAIRRVGQLEMVTVAQDGIAKERMIRTGKKYAAGIEILSGLDAGETIAIP
jgi:RND family efflux transporter MFP subunit